jgi:hypothetical protein
LNVYDPFLDWYEDREERQLWEDKVRFALYGENARVRADVERKREKEEGGPRHKPCTQASRPNFGLRPGQPKLNALLGGDDLADHEARD